MTKKQIDEKFDSIVKFSELERFIDQKLKNFSSGMQVRLAFSVSLHANRDILLMDEVLAVGDINFQSKCIEEFNKYKDAGKTVILVTHDIATVQRYCERAMLIRNGKIVMIGNADEVGIKYIYQNMSDEEGRIANEEKCKNDSDVIVNNTGIVSNEIDESKIKKVAEIIKVEFLDKEEKEKNVFLMGEDISIRIYFKVHDKEKEPFNFGFGLYNLQHIFVWIYYCDK